MMIDLTDGTEQRIHGVFGVNYISTPGHGYLAFEQGAAESLLSEHAKKYGVEQNGILYFEHDVAMQVALLDSNQLLQAMFPNQDADEIAEARDLAAGLVASFYPEYIEAKGISAAPEKIAKGKQRQTEDKLRSQKSPDLIVASKGVWGSFDSSQVRVYTADEKMYFVGKQSYRDLKGDLLLLSKCSDVTPYEQSPIEARFKKYATQVFNSAFADENTSATTKEQRTKASDIIHSLADDYRSALVEDADYYGRPQAGAEGDIHEIHKTLNKAFKECDQNDMTTSPAFQQEAVKGGVALLRQQLAPAIARDRNRSTHFPGIH